MATNQWGEPMPVRLTGPLGRAWSHVYMVNEGFDGEDGIAYSAQQRLIREWNANGPATVTVYAYASPSGTATKRSFATVRAAYAYAETLGEGAEVRAS